MSANDANDDNDVRVDPAFTTTFGTLSNAMSLLAPNSDFRGKWKAPLSKKLLQSYSFAPLCPQSLILGAEAERENAARHFPR